MAGETQQNLSAQVTGQGSWYAQLGAILQAAHDPAVVIPAATYAFEDDKGQAVMNSLDAQQQVVSMEQAQGDLQSMLDTESWAIEEGAAQGAINYVVSNMQQQLQLGLQWLKSQK